MLDDIALSRAIHVLAIVHWIGGLAFVTLIVLPLAKLHPSASVALPLFSSVEQRFASQVRVSVPIAGATGLWMTYRLDARNRFLEPGYWWMHAMVGLWFFFMIMLFVVEPLHRRRFEEHVLQDSVSAFHRVSVLHVVLLLLASLTVLGAVSGAHGVNLF